MPVTDIFCSPIVVTFLIGITTLILLIWHSSMKQSYWRKRGIPYVMPIPILGSVLDNILTPSHEIELKRHLELGPIYGFFEGNRPILSVGDTKLLRDILVKDFQYFSNRRPLSVGDEIFDNILSVLEGEDWKRVRTIITPAFSTKKLKRMFDIFKDCAMTLIQNFNTAAQKGEPIDMKRHYGALAMDIIASSAFSTKIDSHNDPENEFVRTVRKDFGFNADMRVALFLLFPSMMKLFGIAIVQPSITKFFSNLIIQIINERKRTGQKRNDFLQLLIDTTEEVSKEEKWEDSDKGSDLVNNYGPEITGQKVFKNAATKNLSMNELVAQCVIFFLAGYDTTSSTLSFASYLLATNQDVQEKVLQEITQCLKETNGELTYEALQEMKYLDNVISETLRMYPPAFRFERQADSDYKLGNTGITVPKGMIVTVSSYALHRDPKLFPNPDRFDPNRFTAAEKAKQDPYAYLPFGAGPRNCIGMRFGLLEVKMCLVHVLSHFNIKTCPKTQIPIKFKNDVTLLQPKNITLMMEPRKDIPLVK